MTDLHLNKRKNNENITNYFLMKSLTLVLKYKHDTIFQIFNIAIRNLLPRDNSLYKFRRQPIH
jgi:hypothetical protein